MQFKKKKKASQLLLNALSRALHYAAVLVYTEYTSPLVTAQVAIQVFQRCFIVWDGTYSITYLQDIAFQFCHMR